MKTIKKYISLALNEIRGELARDDVLVSTLCSITALMQCKAYLENLYEIIGSLKNGIFKKLLLPTENVA